MQNYWEPFSLYWEDYHKVTFDGINKLILINDSESDINFKVDVYSAWKEWMLKETNSGFDLAISQVGGDPTPNGFLGVTFFLENCWKIRTWEGDHTLNLTGNIFARDGSAVTIPTLNPHSITVSSFVSNLIDVPNIPIAPIVAGVWDEPIACHLTTGTTGEALNDAGAASSTPAEIADAVWDEALSEHTTTGSAGESMGIIRGMFNKVKLILILLFTK